MKKFLLSVALLAGSMSFAQLSGTYTIGGTTPDYATIQAACTDLQTDGQSGPVVFNIRTGDYVESAVLNAVSGNSATNTITFRSEVGDSTMVSVTSATVSTFDFYDVSYIRFEDLSIAFVVPGGGAYAVSFSNSTDQSFDQVSVFSSGSAAAIRAFKDDAGGVSNFSFTNSSVISADNGIHLSSALSNVNNCTIDNATIDIEFNGLVTYASQYVNNLTITDSDISSVNGNAAYVVGNNGAVNDLTLTNSDFHSQNTTAFYAYSDYAMNNGTIDNCRIISPNNNGANLQGYNQGMQNWMISDSYFSGLFQGLSIESDAQMSDITLVNDSIIASNAIYCCGGEGLYLEGNSLIDNISITDCYFWTDSLNYGSYGANIYSNNGTISNLTFSDNEMKARYGVYVYCESAGTNWTIDNNDISTRYTAIDLEPYYGGGNTIYVTNNNVVVDDATGIYMYSDAIMKNVWINGNTVSAHYNSLDLEGYYGSLSDIFIDNNDFNSLYSTSLYLYSDGTTNNVEITNNTLHSDNNYGFEVYGYYGGLSDLWSENNVMTGQYGSYAYTYSTLENITIKNDSIDVSYEAIYLEGEYGGSSNINISDSYVHAMYDYAVDIYSQYGTIANLTIENNVLIADTNNCCSRAIYVECDDSNIDSLSITGNDVYSYYYGIYVEADYGNALNSVISNNNIWAGYYGIYFDGVGSNSEISFNNIYPITTWGNQTNYGIYVYGYDGPHDGVKISNNLMTDIYSTGIEGYYFDDITMENNEMWSTQSNDNFAGITMEYLGGNSKINANKIMSSNESEGIYIGYGAFDILNPLTISNNFITGMDYGFDFYQCTNVNIANNSVSSPEVSSLVYIYNSNNINVWNNALKNYGTSGSIYYGNSSSDITIDYNAYEYDSLVSYMSNDGFFGVNASLFNFQSATAYDDNSINADMMFTNDTTDLHISCSNNALTAGAPLAFVTTDVDGVSRNLTTPTIGAHEISPAAASNILADSTVFCNSADLFTTGSGTILWSTGATTSMITVSAPGTYSVTVTDFCGNDYTESIVVYTEDNVTASFIWGTNDYDAIFNNNSTGAVSYMWDFGDGTTSTATTPAHTYPSMDSVYTVTLIAFDACGGSDTTTQNLTTLYTGLTEGPEASDFNVYPNPTSGNVTVDFALLKGETINIYVIDMDGRVLYSDLITNEMGAYKKQLDLTDLADGMYFITTQTETQTITKRIVKQ